MKCVALLLQFAFIAQAHATAETTSPEDEEALNKLIDTLVDDDKNDELVDMITQKLVDKLLGFVGTMPQMQAMLRPPVPEVRQMMQTPQELQTAPDLVFAGLSPQQLPGNTLNYDASSLTRLPANQQKNTGVRTDRGWSADTTDRNPYPGLSRGGKGGQSRYAGVSFPDASAKYNPGTQEKAGKINVNQASWVKDYRFDKDGVKKPSKAQVAGVERNDFVAGSPEQKNNGFLGLAGSAQDLAAERATVPNLMEEDAEQPDPFTVLCVGILSAFVGSAITFALFRPRLAKAEMQAPLLN